MIVKWEVMVWVVDSGILKWLSWDRPPHSSLPADLTGRRVCPTSVKPTTNLRFSPQKGAGPSITELILLVSPWVDRTVVSTEFDHTSLLRYLSDKRALSPLTKRVSQANSFAPAIRVTGPPREDAPPSISMPMMAMSVEAETRTPESLNENQQALIRLSQHLEPEVQPMAYTATEGVEPQAEEVERAKLRVSEFLQRKKAETGEP